MLHCATIGITRFEASSFDSSIDFIESVSENDFSYGLGVDFGSGFIIEYIQYIDKDGGELNGL